MVRNQAGGERFDMIREGDRIAVGLFGGKDSVTLLEVLLLLQKRAPINFQVCAFTVEQGKFLAPIAPFGEYLKKRGVEWLYVRDEPSFQLIEDEPDHGCDMCSRFRRRAVYEIAKQMGANVIALGHTADDFCESLLRNAMYTGRLSALPAVTWSAKKDFRLIRPLLTFPCCFAHTRQPLGHANLALCRGRAGLMSVLLDQRPSLLILRWRFPAFVRMIHRYSSAVRLLRDVRAGRAAIAFSHRPVVWFTCRRL